jgi:DNA-binding MarR family transcriptional regulator
MSSELDRLGWLIKRVQHGHHRALDTNLAELGITLVQWNALREIERNPGASQHDLAEVTFNSDQAFGTLVTRLKSHGLVERRPGRGRALLLRLTSKGQTLLNDGQEVMTRVLTQSFGPLRQEERAQLWRLLAKILDAGEES